MLASLLWTMIDRYPGKNFFPTAHMLAMPLLNMLHRHRGFSRGDRPSSRATLPRTSIYRRFALMTIQIRRDHRSPGSPRHLRPRLRSRQECRGTAVSVLRPSGKARFADQVVDVVTEGEFIALGQRQSRSCRPTECAW